MKVKNVLLAMVFSVAVLGGYQAYENVSLTSAESFLLENVEALATGESGGTAILIGKCENTSESLCFEQCGGTCQEVYWEVTKTKHNPAKNVTGTCTCGYVF